MNLEGQIKKVKKDFSSNTKFEITMDCLNDDCLLQIFSYLSFQEKLKVEMACKRWSAVAKRSWIYENNLDNLYSDMPHKVNSESNKNKTFIINVLNRCGAYLQKLSFNGCYLNGAIEFSEIWKLIDENCKNVNQLMIDGWSNYFTDEEITLLLKRFTNLHTIHLSFLELKGDFLEHLNTSTLQKVSISYCNFENEEYFSDFLSKLKNLNNLAISYDSDFEIDEIIDELIMYQCNNLLEISIEVGEDEDKCPVISNLSKFVSMQNKLTKFKIVNACVIEINFVNSLPLSLEVVDINRCPFEEDSILYDLNRLKNLRSFACYLNNLNHYCLQAICESLNINLKEIKINYMNYRLKSKESINYFWKLKNLESFSIQGYLWNDKYISENIIDNILIDLSKCKKVKKITIDDCVFSNLGLKSISSLPNLVSLKINTHNPLNDEDYNEFIKNSSTLKELIICNNIKYLK